MAAARDREGERLALPVRPSRCRNTRPRHRGALAGGCYSYPVWLRVMIRGAIARPLSFRSSGRDASSAPAGAGDGTRTRNLLITNQLLYPLSYASAETIDPSL